MLTLKQLVELNRQLRESLISAWNSTDPRLADTHQWPLAFLAAHVARSHEAMELLAANGFGREAGVLLRSIFEATVNAVWISKDFSVRSERFAAYQWVAAERFRGVIERWPSRGGQPTDTDKCEAERVHTAAKEAKRKYGFKSGGNWSGMSVRTMAEDMGWLERYEFIYKIYSEVVHSGAGSANDFVQHLPTGGSVMAIGPQYDQAEACLREGYLYLTATFNCAEICLSVSLQPILTQAWAHMPNVFAGAERVPGTP